MEKKSIDLNAGFRDFRVNTWYKRSFPRTEEEKKEPETLANVLLSCLALYPVKNRQEIFLATGLMRRIVESTGASMEVSEDEMRLLEHVLEVSVFRVQGNKQSGIYQSPIIAQAYEHLGITQ